MRVLLIEDDAMLGKAVQTGLQQQGHAVDWVRDGVTGEAAALANEYAAVLLDLGLPRQDGMQLLEKLRRGGYLQPVIVITSRDDIPERVLGLDAGADDFHRRARHAAGRPRLAQRPARQCHHCAHRPRVCPAAAVARTPRPGAKSHTTAGRAL